MSTVNVYVPQVVKERMRGFALPWSQIAADAFRHAMDRELSKITPVLLEPRPGKTWLTAAVEGKVDRALADMRRLLRSDHGR